MSWSISLSGPKEMVEAELDAAQNALNGARQALYPITTPTVALNASGSAYRGSDGSAGSGASFNVSGIVPLPPDPPVAVLAPEAAPQSS